MNDLLVDTLRNWVDIALWGLIATAVMTSVLEGAQLFGLSRLSLPFLFGTFVTASRVKAIVFGFIFYVIGAWLFAIVYALAFESLGRSDWWLGIALGLVHGIFLVAVFLPLLPYVHPRLASEFSGPTERRRIEPPGAFGLNYGRATPAATVAAQSIFGLVMAIGYQV